MVDIGPVPDLGPCRAKVYPTQVVSIPRPDKPVEFTGKVPEQRYEPPPDSQRIQPNKSVEFTRGGSEQRFEPPFDSQRTP